MDTIRETPTLTQPKVLLIGLDGASFNYIDPLLEKKLMPNLKQLMEQGTKGRLKSVMPPQTPAAWASMYTGKNPGKHGIFDWWYPSKFDYTLIPFSAKSIKAVPIWHILSRSNIKVGIMNIPLTYPVKVVNGFFICGLDNPYRHLELEEGVTYPPGLLKEIRENCCDYKIHIDPANCSTMEELLTQWILMESNRTKAACYLIDKFQPEFMWIHYHMGDYFAHRAKKNSDIVAKAYAALDENIGEIIKKYGKKTIIFVVSDHGQIEISKFIMIHNWLEQNGLLTYNTTIADLRIGRIIQQYLRALVALSSEEEKVIIDELVTLWKNLPTDIQHKITNAVRKRFPGCCKSHTNIDWSKTKAFTCSFYGQIYINLNGREPNGIVKQGTEYDDLVKFIIHKLKELKDPVTGKKIVKEASRKEDVYQGSSLSIAPDIICFLNDYSYHFCPIYHFYLENDSIICNIDQDAIARDFRLQDRSFFADHSPDGILVTCGSCIRKKHTVYNASVMDITPTILHIFHCPVPSDMDGMILKDIFSNFRPSEPLVIK